MDIIAFSPTDNVALQKFHVVPQQVYANDKLWTPQSEAAVTALFAGAGKIFMRPLLCLQGDVPVARAVAIFHRSAIDEQMRPQGYVGFFECLESHHDAGRMILEHAENILREQGVVTVQAPRVDNMLMGLVVGGDASPQTVFTPHNPPHYVEILQSQGYQIRERLYTYILDRSSVINFPVRLPGYHTRSFDRSRLDEEVLIFHSLQKEIFKDYAGWVPRTLEEDRQMIEGFLPMLDDDLVVIAENKDHEAIGLLVCIPDVYQAFRGQTIDRARLISIGAIPSKAQKGVGVVMGLHLMRALLAKGYQTLEASWIRDANIQPQNLVKRFGGRRGREFALFEKELIYPTNS
jgi:hypothetical protein